MIDTLAKHGYDDIMYRIAVQTTYPGWGYMVSQGATTIWENWGVRQAESMVMWLTLDEFFYNDLAGIRGPEYYGPETMTPGFRTIEIKPRIQEGLTFVDASFKTVRGMVSSHWRRTPDGLDLYVMIPVNSSARVSVPTMGFDNVRVSEGGRTVWSGGGFVSGVPGIAKGMETDGFILFETGSGLYSFRVEEQK
jgi:alpha-L-rhamnosidase